MRCLLWARLDLLSTQHGHAHTPGDALHGTISIVGHFTGRRVVVGARWLDLRALHSRWRAASMMSGVQYLRAKLPLWQHCVC